MRHQILEEALDTIRAAGFEPSVVRGKHWKVSWVDRSGRVRLLVVSFSPSARRTRVQSRTTLRRLLAS